MLRPPQKTTVVWNWHSQIGVELLVHVAQRWGNINTWLVKNGYMRLKGQDDTRYNLKDLFGGGDFFVNVDWQGTRAYSLGLGLIFFHLAGRESQGLVPPGEE